MSLCRLELEPMMKVTLSRGINQSHGLEYESDLGMCNGRQPDAMFRCNVHTSERGLTRFTCWLYWWSKSGSMHMGSTGVLVVYMSGALVSSMQGAVVYWCLPDSWTYGCLGWQYCGLSNDDSEHNQMIGRRRTL